MRPFPAAACAGCGGWKGRRFGLAQRDIACYDQIMTGVAPISVVILSRIISDAPLRLLPAAEARDNQPRFGRSRRAFGLPAPPRG